MQGSTGGTNQKRMAAQWPALKKRKISQTVFTLDPCALRPFHVHQRADGLLYVISGALATTAGRSTHQMCHTPSHAHQQSRSQYSISGALAPEMPRSQQTNMCQTLSLAHQ